MTGKGHGILYDGDARKQTGAPDEIADYLWAMQDQLSTYRRDMHKIPELGFDTFETHAYLMNTLKDMGYSPKKVGDTTGIMVDIQGEDTSFTIGVRADIDGLPITEVDDGRTYRSMKKGQMHACGHDGHASVALGVAKAYADGNETPQANIRLIFQPAEEIGAGAAKMIEEGVLKDVDVIIGLHSDPTREWGRVGLTPKNWSAFATGFTYEIIGKAAHAGIAPHEGKDPVVTGSYIVTMLQSVVNRNVAAADAAVVSVSMFQAGTALNQISDKAVLSGTTRAQEKDTHEFLKVRLSEVGEAAEKAMGMPVNFKVLVEVPGVINNPVMFELAKQTSLMVLGENNVDIFFEPNMGGEDFAYYSELIPAFFYWLGVGSNDKNIIAGLHTPDFDMDERGLVVGTALQLANIKAIADYKKSGGKF